MKITAEFDSIREMKEFAKLFVGETSTPTVDIKVQGVTVETEKVVDRIVVKEIDKAVDEATVTKEDPSEENEPIEDTKEEKKEGKVTKEMVRAAFSKLLKAGKQAEAKELTSKYGAAKLPDVKEEDYAAILKDAEGLL